MAASGIDTNGPNFPITSKPAALVFGRQDATSSRKIYTYPECADDPTGPCSLSASSSEACKREFATVASAIYEEPYCKCTNDYYVRSSE